MDVFLIAGQSNARGTGAPAAAAPDVPEGVAFEWTGDGLAHLADPVGDDHEPTAPVGSAWPAFAVTYHGLTGRASVYVPGAVGGAALLGAADSGNGYWEVGADSPLFDRAVRRTWDCLTHLCGSDDPTFRGVLWSQGERDAQAIDAGAVGAPEYRGALRELVRAFRREFDRPDLPVYLFRTGRTASGDTDGFAAVRAAQSDLAAHEDAVHLVFEGAVDFPGRGLMRDEVHYTQDGYNEMGRVGAEGVAAAIEE